MADDQAEFLRREVQRLTDGIRVTKIVATRAMKSDAGESFAGFSAGFDSIEDSSGVAFDASDISKGGMTLRDARLSYYVLAMYADISAIDAAWASGSIPAQYRNDLTHSTRQRYLLLLRKHILGDSDVEIPPTKETP